MTVWIKDNGKEITLNDEKATIEAAESMGWKRKAKKTKKQKAEDGKS